MTPKKIFRKLFVSFLSLMALLAIIIAIALNVVFTPKKITPVVVNAINQQLNATVHCESVELTFFSTFPRFGVKLNNTWVKSLDTGTEKDTLAIFKKGIIVFDVYKYLKNNDVDINKIKIESPKLYAFVGKDGTNNWNIVKPSEETATTNDSLQINDITVRSLQITNATLVHDDEVSNFKHQVNSFSVDLKAEKTAAHIKFGLATASKNIQAFYKGGFLHQINDVGVDLFLDLDRTNRKLTINSKDITVNNIHFTAKGALTPSKENCALGVHLEAGLTSNSINHFLDVVPEKLFPKKDIITEGAVDFSLQVDGFYGSGYLPVVSVAMKLKNGSLAYNNFPGSIKELEAKASGVFYLDNYKPSEVTIDTINVHGTGIALEGSAHITNVLQNPFVDASINGDVNLTELYSKFPVDSTIMLKGSAKATIKGKFLVADIENEKYEDIDVGGNIHLANVTVNSAKDSVQFTSKKTAVQFYRETKVYKQTFANLELEGTDVVYKNNIELHAREVKAKATAKEVATTITRRSTKNAHKKRTPRKRFLIDIEASMADVHGRSKEDSLGFMLKKTNVKANLYPRQKEQKTYITSVFSIDSVGLKQGGHFIGVRKGSYDIRLDKVGRKKWIPQGTVSFRKLFAKVDKVPTPLEMPATKISFVDDDITLEKAFVHFGDSKVMLTGNIEHFKGFFTGNLVKANLNLRSKFINTNQLMGTFAGVTEEVATTTTTNTKTADTTALSATHKQAFKIPDSLQFTFTTHIKTLKFGYSYFEDIEGALKLTNGSMYLNNFKLKTKAANLETDVVYTPKPDNTAAIDFRFYLTHIEMSKLNEVLPVLDSLFPASKSFVGEAEFRIKGTGLLTSDLDFNTASVKGIAALKAHDIMVLDGPTFADLAKTLKFKSKELNPVKRLEVEMQIQKNTLNVLPALLEIDRYRLAVGGEQHLDLSYGYHISVLKSPVPFKMGIDVDGKDTDYKIKLTNAKYKYYFTDKERLLKKADSTIINAKNDIRKALGFEKVVVNDDL